MRLRPLRWGLVAIGGCLAMACSGGGTGASVGPDASMDVRVPPPDAGPRDAGPSAAECGNGIVETGEQCDDGNEDRFDGCLASCERWVIPEGEPIDTPSMEWRRIEFDNTQCRDGSNAGIGVSRNPDSDKVLIYLEGGGACFNEQCELLALDIPFIPPPDGIFNRNRERNPVRDWNMVYVPYCTGDVHAGNAPDTRVEGVAEPQNFVGYANIGKFLERLVPTFQNASQVLLTGISAGGFGAAANYERVQEAFGPTPVTLLDDSGPPMPAEVLAPCLQARWRELWNLDETILADCGDDCPDPDNYVFDLGRHLMREFPERTGGLFSNTRDTVIRTFYGFGSNMCDPLVPNTPAEDFRAGLTAFRELAQSQEGEFGTYYFDGLGHTCLRGPCYYTMEVDDVPLTEWVGELLSGTGAHIGP